jgi:hypothetical protein
VPLDGFVACSKCNLVFEVTPDGTRECNLVFVLSDLAGLW